MSQKSEVYVSSNIRTLAVLTLVTVLIWTGLSIYHTSVAKIDLSVSADMLKPIDPSLDADTLNALAQRRQLTDDPAAGDALQQALELIAASPKPTKTAKATINEVTPVASPSDTATASANSAL
jgi:hypothetical protein